MSRPSASVVFVLAVGLALAPRFAAAGAPPAALATTAPTTPITPVTSDPALPPAHHLELRLRADSLWAARARKEATPLYRQVVDDCPADGESRFRLAAGLAALGRRAEAADELKRCLADGFVDIAPSAYQLAAAAAEGGRTDEALAMLTKAVDLAPKDEDLRAELWTELRKQLRYQDIVDLADKLGDMKDRDWKLRWNEAEAYLGLGKQMEARALFTAINADERLHVDIRKKAKRAVRQMEMPQGLQLTPPDPSKAPSA